MEDFFYSGSVLCLFVLSNLLVIIVMLFFSYHKVNFIVLIRLSFFLRLLLSHAIFLYPHFFSSFITETGCYLHISIHLVFIIMLFFLFFCLFTFYLIAHEHLSVMLVSSFLGEKLIILIL